MPRVQPLDATAYVVGERVPRVGRAGEVGRDDGWLHLDRVQRQDLERLARPDAVTVEEQPPEGGGRIRLLVRDPEAALLGRAGVGLLLRRRLVPHHQQVRQVELARAIDVDVAEEQEAAVVEHLLQEADRAVVEPDLQVDADDLGTQRRAELVSLRLRHGVGLLGRTAHQVTRRLSIPPPVRSLRIRSSLTSIARRRSGNRRNSEGKTARSSVRAKLWPRQTWTP